MSGLLAQAESAVSIALSSEWPGNAWEVRFSPVADPTLGDIGTDALLQVARDLRESTETIAKRVLVKLSPSALGEFSFIEGFLNLHIADSKIIEPWEDERAPEVLPHTILLAPRRSGTDSLGYARVVASASMQWLLLNSGATIISTAGKLSHPFKWQDFKRWFLLSSCGEAASEEATENVVTQLGSGSKEVTLWAYSKFMERKKFQAFLKKIADISGSECAVMSLDRDAITRLGRAIDERTLAALSDEELSALVIYLSRAVSGADVDLLAIKHAERSNLRWSLGALMQSMERWKHLQSKASFPLQLASSERSIAILYNSMSALRRAAAVHGRVGEYLAQIEAMIEQTGKYLNNPMMRMRLERGESTPALGEIIAGVRQASSDIMNSCLLFQSPAPARQQNR